MTEQPRPEPLPIDEALPQIIDTLRRHSALALRAPTGAGKTTRVPPALLAAGLAEGKQVVVLEPRRVAARAAARRIADEQGWACGGEVGYQVRFERRVGPKTRIAVVTEGILLQMLQADPFLAKVGIVVLDELHERSLTADLALAMTRKVQLEARPDLRLVAMSATLETEPLARFLGDCPIVESQGRLYPVDVAYQERPDDRPLPARVAAGARRLLRETQGDVLAFLPGVGEIRRTADLLEDLHREVEVLSLYGDLPPEQQDRALARTERRKLVLATNVAETSITIDGISAVVDSGMERVLRFDPGRGLDRLELGRISRASAEQRAGRAGRQGPGRCLRLWTRHDDRSLTERAEPEIRRADLTATVLQLMAWGEREVAAFPWFQAPEPDSLRRAEALLRRLGAIDAHGVTRLGRTLARLPLPPRLARLVIAGHELGAPRRCALAAALLTERDFILRDRPGGQGAFAGASPDILDRVEALEAFDRSRATGSPAGALHRGRARHVLRVAGQIQRLARSGTPGPAAGSPGETDEAVSKALLAAYPDRVARRREPNGRRALMVGGRGVRLAEQGALGGSMLFLCLDLKAGRSGAHNEALVYQASTIEAEWLRLETVVETAFDAEAQRVLGVERTRYLDLVLAEKPAHLEPRGAEETLCQAAGEQLEAALPLEAPELAGWLCRIRCLADWMPELDLPTFRDEDLRQLLPALCAGKRSFAELRRAPLLESLRGSLSFAQLESLERHAPDRIAVPSGSKIKLRYKEGEPPVLAARIQELFGLAETPRLAAGRVPVLLHLLAPNMRPQQVTQDLASFWSQTYQQVRKELQGRYPRHAWPADPSQAVAEKRPRRKRQP